MTRKRCCEECGSEFVPYVGRQRFCCRSCSDAYFAEEKRQALEFFRRNREASEEQWEGVQ
jgi:hypothetical protein